MSLHNESLDYHKSDEAPGLEYRSVSHDSLSMFLAAVGGAILGVLLTLLILAIINNGTLNFTGNPRIQAIEQTVDRVNENVGTLSGNLDVVAAELASIRSGMVSADETLQAVVASQQTQNADVSEQLSEVGTAIETLDDTRARFDAFVAALTTALNEMQEEHPAE